MDSCEALGPILGLIGHCKVLGQWMLQGLDFLYPQPLKGTGLKMRPRWAASFPRSRGRNTGLFNCCSML